MNTPILDRCHSPADVKKLNNEELPVLCSELRQLLVETTAATGGHLSSNLGVVELTVALHRIFDSPQDKIVWDVGHQCYAHKILTGRRERFSTLRQKDGLSGFPKPKESEHDAFVAGHSGTSISAASGIARAKTLKKDPHTTIAVIGDGSFTCGMAYEALNNAARSGDRIIVVLNDNKMSISKNESNLAKYLSKVRSKPDYFRLKDNVQKVCRHIPLVGEPLEHGLEKVKSMTKTLLYGSNFFEDLGFRYLGPVDGHNLEQLCSVLSRAKELEEPIFLHIETQKGRGYSYAEKNPGEFHGTSGFDIETGKSKPSFGSFSDEFGKHLTAMAKEDDSICAITAAMKYGTGLNHFSKEFKDSGRFFDVGIAESHAVTFGAGLAVEGRKPVFAVYSSFLQRCYDQLIHDCSIEPQHLVLAIDRAGIVGADGETHNGLFDVAMLLNIPGVSIYSPATYEDLRYSMEKALNEHKGLCAVRYPRGAENKALAERTKPHDYELFHKSDSKLIVSYGRISADALQAAEQMDCSFLRLLKITPLDEEIYAILRRYDRILFVEEGIRTGGLAEHVAAKLLEQDFHGKYRIRAVENRFVPHASPAEATALCRLDAQSLIEDYSEFFK